MTTRLLKEAILLAAELEGHDGRGKDELADFLRRVANEDIRAFAMLLGRVLPLQVEARTDMSVEVTTKQSRKCAGSWRTAAFQSKPSSIRPSLQSQTGSRA